MRQHTVRSDKSTLRAKLRGETSRRVITSLVSSALVLQPIIATAGPTGGVVTAGSAEISATGLTTRVEQIDARVVIDWSSFDIDADEAVVFSQPSTRSVALNRVVDTLPTNIRGKLEANGDVWIVNQNGVTFHAGSVVDVGGLIATSADITNEDFLAGNDHFSIPGKPGAQVINNGSITFGNAGLTALVAPGAQNHGRIAGKLGSVIVAGEKTFAIDMAGDGLLAFEAKGGANFSGQATNTGTISNQGGYILITARTAKTLVDNTISLGGRVEATTAEMRDGNIVLSGGDGVVNVEGTVSATGNAEHKGGSIKVSGGRIDVRETASIDVSGGAGGGTAEIGGGFQGSALGAGLRNAQDTIVRQGATIAADALNAGNGGTAIVWADGYTGYTGTISAKGGIQGGDGGTVEVSGRSGLGFHGHVDTSAPAGEIGTLLLDPTDIVVIDSIGGNLAGTGDGLLPSVTFADLPTNMTISDVAIENASSSVTLQATNSVTIGDLSDDTLSINGGQSFTIRTGAGGFSMNASDAIAFSSGGDLTIDARDSAAMGAGPVNIGRVSGATTGTLRGTSVTFSGASDFGALSVDATGMVTQSAPVLVTGLTNVDAVGSVVDLTNAGNDFDGQINLDGTDISVSDSNNISLGTVIATGSLTVTAGGSITDTAGEAITVAGATDLVAFDDQGDADPTNDDFFDVALDNVDTHDFMDVVNATGEDIHLDDANAIALGDVDAGGDLTVTAGGSIEDTAGEAITVAGMTDLAAGAVGDSHDILLDNEDTHDFSGDDGVDFSEMVGFQARIARNVIVNDRNHLLINSLNDIDGNVTLVAGSGLTIGAEDLDQTYQLAASSIWNFTAKNGDLDVVGQLQGAANELNVDAPDGTIRFRNVVGNEGTRIETVRVLRAGDVVFGLSERVDPSNSNSTIPNNIFLIKPGNASEDIFFVSELELQTASGDVVLYLSPTVENFGDFQNQYFGLNILNDTGFTYGSILGRIDLFGKIGAIRSKAAGLSPIGPRSGRYQFNNCVIGDTNSCSAITNAAILRLIDPTPVDVFALDEDQIDELFFSFGNEELWGLPRIFVTDFDEEQALEETK